MDKYIILIQLIITLNLNYIETPTIETVSGLKTPIKIKVDECFLHMRKDNPESSYNRVDAQIQTDPIITTLREKSTQTQDKEVVEREDSDCGVEWSDSPATCSYLENLVLLNTNSLLKDYPFINHPLWSYFKKASWVPAMYFGFKSRWEHDQEEIQNFVRWQINTESYWVMRLVREYAKLLNWINWWNMKMYNLSAWTANNPYMFYRSNMGFISTREMYYWGTNPWFFVLWILLSKFFFSLYSYSMQSRLNLIIIWRVIKAILRILRGL